MQYWGSSFWGGSYWGGTTAYWASLILTDTTIRRIFHFRSKIVVSLSNDSIMTKSFGIKSHMTKQLNITTELTDV